MSVWYRGPHGTIGTIVVCLLGFLFLLIFSIGLPFMAIKLLINGEDVFFAIGCFILCPYFIGLTKAMYDGMKEEIKIYKGNRK